MAIKMDCGSKDIEHIGKIVQVKPNSVQVEIQLAEACGKCASKNMCSMGTLSAKRIIEVKGSTDLEVGSSVIVYTHLSTGVKAILLGYVIPLILLILTLIVASVCEINDGLMALSALGIVAMYYLILYFLRNKISKTITFLIKEVR